MALEPFVQSNVYDLSGGLLPVPEDTGYNIVMPVYTPAGPLEKTKVASQKEFLNKFMTSAKILPDDHISAQFAYSVLASNPVYVMRACPDGLHEGVSCEGYKYLFDSEYNLIPSYKQFDVDLELKNADYQLSSGNQTWSNQNSFKDLLDSILYTASDNGVTGNSAGILSASGNQIISNIRLSSNEYIGKFEESVKNDAFYKLSFAAGSVVGTEAPWFASLNENTYEIISSLGQSPTSYLTNNHPVYSQSMNALWLGLSALAQEQCMSQVKNISIEFKSASKVTAVVASGIPSIDAESGAEPKLLANVPMTYGSIGVFANKRVKARTAASTTAGSEWYKNLVDVQVGDIYIKNDFTEYYTIAAVRQDIPQDTDSITVQTTSPDSTSAENPYPNPGAGTDGAYFSNHDGAKGWYLTVKNGNNKEYYNLSSGNYVVVSYPEGNSAYTALPDNVPTDLDEANIGQTAIVFNGTSSIQIAEITTVVGVSNPYNTTETSYSNVPSITVTCDTKTYIYLSSKEACVLAANTSLEASDNGTKIMHSRNCSSSAAFLVSVLGDFLNADGLYADKIAWGADNANIVFKGSLDLYVPTYSSAEAHGQFITLETSAYTYYYAVDANNNDAQVKFDQLQIVVGDTTYYVGEAPSTTYKTKLSDDPCNESEFKEKLQKALLSSNIYMFNGHYISTNADLLVQKGECSESCEMIIDSSVVEQNPTETFAIVSKFPCSTALSRFSYEYNHETKIVDLYYNYKNGIVTEEWTMSFVPGVVDGYGIDQWYTRVKSDYFQVVPLKSDVEPLESYQSSMFGGSVAIPAYDDQMAADAISEITNYEDGIQYEIISDAGICSPNLANTIGSLTKQLWAVYPISIPAYTKKEDVVFYLGGLGADCKQFECRAWAVADRMPVGTFSAVIPGSYKCINKMIEASRSGSMEFAPIGGLNHGTVGVVNLVQNWKKKDREDLLDYRVCTVKGGVTTPYYINQNYTMQPAKSYMLEEQNVRMTNAAIHVVQTLAVNYLHELNTKRLRDKVQENVNKAIQDRLFKGKAYTPAQYMAVCDDSNNPISIIEQNKLVISLYASFTPSIHYILIDHYIVSLDQINSAEGSITSV